MKIYIITALTFLIWSCSSKQSDQERNASFENDKKNSEFEKWTPNTFYITDTSISKNPFVKLTTIDQNGTYEINWGNDTSNYNGNLMSLTKNQGYRMPPTVLWSNKNFICMMTNHSGPYSQHLFLPLKENGSPIFFEEDVEYADSIDNFVCYIHPRSDSTQETITWTIRSLLNDKSEEFQLDVDEFSLGYPWYHKIYRQGNFIIIEYSNDKVKKFNIEKYCT